MMWKISNLYDIVDYSAFSFALLLSVEIGYLNACFERFFGTEMLELFLFFYRVVMLEMKDLLLLARIASNLKI